MLWLVIPTFFLSPPGLIMTVCVLEKLFGGHRRAWNAEGVLPTS